MYKRTMFQKVPPRNVQAHNVQKVPPRNVQTHNVQKVSPRNVETRNVQKVPPRHTSHFLAYYAERKRRSFSQWHYKFCISQTLSMLKLQQKTIYIAFHASLLHQCQRAAMLTERCCTAQRELRLKTTQHNTTQHNTAQHNTTQHNTAHVTWHGAQPCR